MPVFSYYNEHDPQMAEWLKELIRRGLIARGIVDTRSIEDVVPNDLVPFTQCHFFAGIGTWSYALRQAGWGDDRPVWTGSCPCQPFSSAGKGAGFADERHLWPAFFHLISQCRPDTVFGEQVASKDGLAWLDLVSSNMEGEGYTLRPVDLCAAGVGAPHIRQRLFWVADRKRLGWQRGKGAGGPLGEGTPKRGEGLSDTQRSSDPCGVANTETSERGSAGSSDDPRGRVSQAGGPGRSRHLGDPILPRPQGLGGGVHPEPRDSGSGGEAPAAGDAGDLADPMRSGRPERRPEPGDGQAPRPGPTNGFWGDAEWLYCRDEKWRPTQPGLFPLADGTAFALDRRRNGRAALLRGIGNAINAEVAKEFIRAYLDTVSSTE